MRRRLSRILYLLASVVLASGLITSPLNPQFSTHNSLQKLQRSSTTRLLSSPDTEDKAQLLSPENSLSNLRRKFQNARSEGFGTRARNVAPTCEVGDIVVPLCGDLEKRQQLAARGVYPGVEYLICDLSDAEGSQRVATIRPAYALREHLERSDWPVTVPLSDVPLWLSKTTYEAGTALGTLMFSGSFLATAAIIASFLRLAVIPSESMIPALMPGDVVLVTRTILPPKVGDVVFFDPPSSLDKAIANSKIGRAAAANGNLDGVETVSVVSTKGKQFIKRVVGVPGESVGVFNSNPYAVLCSKNTNECKYRIDRSGQYSRPDIFPDESWAKDKSVLGENEFFVAGDNGYRSVDSRVWGTLKKQNIFGTAQFIVFPPSHAGRIPDGNIQIEDVLQ